MQAAGAGVDDIRAYLKRPNVDIWPDNAIAYAVFCAMDTQWRVGGMGRASGLDYAALPFVMRQLGVPRAEWTDIFDAVRVMERAALDEMHKE
ncbi:DUF1799 domain-containing protein [Pigmentiphaga kullae]|uniref:Uncharacterized protein DUF1799 n=1 Tax=Pigmentiphaga kullae TaxID=151784 RepID=A0A4Q7NCH6_9BURK|nr:DUF1799 domain-containing protein [Pigmentiphaga kullae]RZS80655.1 uncharacterized protein DUF1799 [Pigmentiphaga kullae]